MKPPTEPIIGTVVISWNNQDILGECFESLQEQDNKDHVTLLVDNGSKDDSVSFTKERFPWVEVYEARANLGFARGNNIGIEYLLQKYSSLEYIVLLNSDARLDSKWLSTMVPFAERKPMGALFQSTTLDYYNHDIIDSTHVYISRNGSGTQGMWRRLHLGENGPKRVFGANAAAVMVSRAFIEQQPEEHFFDTTLFMYLEDVDINARATVTGWDNYLVPGTYAYHMGSASSNKRPGFSLYMTYRNNIAVLCKNIPVSLLLRMLPHIIRADYHTMRHLRRTGKARGIYYLLKGRVIGFVRLPLFLPGVWRMRTARKTISKEYLWSLMKYGD